MNTHRRWRKGASPDLFALLDALEGWPYAVKTGDGRPMPIVSRRKDGDTYTMELANGQTVAITCKVTGPPTYQEKYDAERDRLGAPRRKLPREYERNVVNRDGATVGACVAGGNGDRP